MKKWFQNYLDKKYAIAVLKSMTDYKAEHLKSCEICFRSGYMETKDLRLLNYLKEHDGGVNFYYRGCSCNGHLCDKEDTIIIEFDCYPENRL